MNIGYSYSGQVETEFVFYRSILGIKSGEIKAGV